METPISKPKYDRATTEELQFYVNFCRERPQLQTGKNSPKSPRQMQELWNELADGLNALRGPTRTASKWKETLGVWKSQLWTRARRIKMSQRVTGGGPCSKPMTDFEELALSTFGLAAVEGATSSGCFGLMLPQQAVTDIVVDVPLLSPGGSMPSPGSSLPSPGLSLDFPSPECSVLSPEEGITENDTNPEDVVMPMVRPTRSERKNYIAELMNSIKRREEREKQREEIDKQQQMVREQQQRETVLALQSLTSSVAELVKEIRKINK